MKTHKNGSTWSKPQEIPTFDGSEFGTDKTKSKETKDSLEQKQNLLTKLLDEYTKPKSLIELYNDNVKRIHDNDNHDGEDDDDDHDDDINDDEERMDVNDDDINDDEEKMDVNDDEDILNDNDDDEKMEKTSVKLLPITRIGLEKRFIKLFYEFTKQKKLENRTELVLLLDEMLRHEYITPLEYESFNTILADSIKVQEKGDIWKLIESTTRDLIKNDKEEVNKLIVNFKLEAGEDFIDSVLELEKLVELFIDGKATLSSILDICRSLENSSLLLSEQLRLKMLFNDIADNRHRVQAILRRLNDERDDNTLKQLVREQLLSSEQYEKIKEDSDLTDIADIIKDTKVGRGLKFLPRTINDLRSKMQVLLKEVATKGLDAIKNELIAILDELLHKNGITKNEYTSINNDIKKGQGWGYYGYLL